MLENEHDTNHDNPPAPPVRRRRAASRPAGPPSSAPDAPSVQTLDLEIPAEPVLNAPAVTLPEADAPPAADPEPAPPAVGSEADAPPAKKTAGRRTSKKAAAAPSDAAPSDGETAEPARVRAPRKRAAKKTAAEPAEPLLVAEPLAAAAPELPAVPEPEPEATQTVEAPEAPSSIEAALAELAQQHAVEADASDESATEEPVLEETADETATDEPAVDDAEADTDETDPTAETGAVEDSDDDADEGDGRRRRRRRGGRRRRRTGGDEDSNEPEDRSETTGGDAPESTEAGEPRDANETGDDADGEDDSADGDGSGEGDGTRRRRRRRRRRGEDAGSSADDPGEVVVRVREPRRSAKPSNEVTGIEGSTRMEAKRQRRRDGREAGRRRTPILSEAEFLARREAVARKMIIRQRDDLAQIAVLEDDILVEHYVDRDSATSLIGNVYLGRVQNVLPSMEAAFIDIGRGRNAVLYAGEVDWDSFGAEGQGRKVERVLKSGQTILVQVTKDPVGAKGARLTNHVSIPGRYIVYAPGGHLSGISRKLPENERKRLKDILSDLVGESASVIVRTAAEGASEDELIRDVNRLKAQWEDIEKKVSTGQAPQLLYGEPDLTVRIVRDLFTEDFAELIIAGNGGVVDAYDAVEAYVSHVAPHLADRLRRWDAEADGDVFGAYRLDEQIAKALERKVFLPSGGSLVIDRTEAMTVIDVNTGKFTGAGGNLEATVTSNNLEAAEEIVRQLRLRDIGGIIVIDFIDMVLPSNRELLLRRLVECLGRDRTRHQVAEITSLGLVQMTRKKIGTGLLEAFTTECPHCHGRGVELHDLPVDSQKQADGGAREPRSRDRRGPRPQPPANGHVAPEPTPVESESPAGGGGDDKPTRGRRGGRGRRGSGHETDPAPEPESAESVAPEPEPAEPMSPEPESLESAVPEPEPAEPTFAEPESVESAAPEPESAEPVAPEPETVESAPVGDPQGEPVPVS